LFPAWIKAIARRTLRRYRHRRQGIGSAPAYLSCWEKTEISSAVPAPPEIVDQKELARQVRTAVATLGSLDRQTIEAHYFRGESLCEMSHRLGCPLGTVKRRLHTARRRLAQQLERFVSA
jgi:RNA polymerase sigma-70 factor (ECF subfamily)